MRKFMYRNTVDGKTKQTTKPLTPEEMEKGNWILVTVLHNGQMKGADIPKQK